MSELEIEDFDTAKAVFEKLKDLPEDRRKRILTWVAEGLGISLAKPVSPSPPAPPPPPGTYPPPPPPGGATDIKTFIAGKAPRATTSSRLLSPITIASKLRRRVGRRQ